MKKKGMENQVPKLFLSVMNGGRGGIECGSWEVFNFEIHFLQGVNFYWLRPKKGKKKTKTKTKGCPKK